MDIIFIGGVVGFFALTVGLLLFFDKIRGA